MRGDFVNMRGDFVNMRRVTPEGVEAQKSYQPERPGGRRGGTIVDEGK